MGRTIAVLPREDPTPQKTAGNAALKTELQLLGTILVASLVAWALTSLVALPIVSLLASTSLAVVLVLVIQGFMVLLGVPILLQYLVPPWFERRQLARIQAGQDIAAGASVYNSASVSRFGLVCLPLGVSVVVISFAALHDLWLVIQLIFFTSILAIMFSFIYHRLPNSRRAVKYAAYSYGSSGIAATLVFSRNRPSDGAIFLWLISQLSAVTVFLVLRRLIKPTEPLRPGEASTRRALAWHRWSMSVAPGPGIMMAVTALLRAIPFVGDFFWAARAWSMMRLARAPVLFLRAFSHEESSSLLAKAVTPALSRVCVMAALVHPSQSAATLNRQTNIAWTPYTFSVANDRWKQWFEQQLSSALAVVIDAAILSDSTRWELGRALQVLGRDRVAVLLPQGGSRAALDDCLVFEYPVEAPRTLHQSLSHWIDWVIDQAFRRNPAAQAAE